MCVTVIESLERGINAIHISGLLTGTLTNINLPETVCAGSTPKRLSRSRHWRTFRDPFTSM